MAGVELEYVGDSSTTLSDEVDRLSSITFSSMTFSCEFIITLGSEKGFITLSSSILVLLLREDETSS